MGGCIAKRPSRTGTYVELVEPLDEGSPLQEVVTGEEGNASRSRSPPTWGDGGLYEDFEEFMEQLMLGPTKVHGLTQSLDLGSLALSSAGRSRSDSLGEGDEVLFQRELDQRCQELLSKAEELSFLAPAGYTCTPREAAAGAGSLSPPANTEFWRRDGSTTQKVLLRKVNLLHIAVTHLSDMTAKYIEAIVEHGADVRSRAWYSIDLAEGESEPLTSLHACTPMSNQRAGCFVQCSVQPLHLAISACNVDAVGTLLDLQADVETRSTFDAVPDITPFNFAQLLLQEEESSTPIPPGIPRRSAALQEILRILVERKADVNATDLAIERPCDPTVVPLPPRDIVGRIVMLKSKAQIKHGARELGARIQRDTNGKMTLDSLQGHHLKVKSRISGNDAEVCCTYRGIEITLPIDDLQVQGWDYFRGQLDCIGKDSELEELSTMPAGDVRSDESRRALQKADLENAIAMRGTKLQGTQSLAFSSGGTDSDANETSQSIPAPSSPSSPMASPMSPNFNPRTLFGFRSGKTANLPQARATPNKGPRTFGAVEEGFKSAAKSKAMLGTGLNLELDNPLPPGVHHTTRKLFRGCLIHFAVYRVCEHAGKELEANVVADLRLALKLGADINAKAYYIDSVHRVCAITPLIFAVAKGSVKAVELLLEHGAPREGLATKAGHTSVWSPLCEAVLLPPSSSAMVKLLLDRKADPNGAAGSRGMACLHTAVQRNRTEAIHLLVEARADVSQETCRFITSDRSHMRANIPLSFIHLADQPYDETTRGELSALLVPSFRGEGCLYKDLYEHVSTNSRMAEHLVKRLLQTASQSKDGEDEALKQILRIRNKVKCDSVELAKIEYQDELVSPLEVVAELIECAPRTGVTLLKDVLLDFPSIEDPDRSPLPHRVNLNCKSMPLLEAFSYTSAMLTEYQPDANRDRDIHRRRHHGRDRVHANGDPGLEPEKHVPDWPCWLYKEGEPAPAWQSALCPRAPEGGDVKRRRTGKGHPTEYEVKVKVLLLANVMDVRLLVALSNMWVRELYAEHVVQAIISCTYNKIAAGTVYFWVAMDTILFGVFLCWSGSEQDEKFRMRACWTFVCAMAFMQIFILFWWLRSSLSNGYGFLRWFTDELTPFFKLLRCCFLVGLLWRTFIGHNLDHSWLEPLDEDDTFGRSYERGLLGANIVVQGFQCILLLRGATPEAEFGRHIQSIWHSFGRLWSIIIVLAFIFGSLSSAFLVMESRLPFLKLMQKVYRGLILGDGDGLDVMEGGEGHRKSRELDVLLTVFSTFIVTVCLLNVSVAVFTSEYDKALKDSYLHFWKLRGKLCSQVLQSPRWPWSGEGEESRCRERRLPSMLITLVARGLQLAHNVIRYCRGIEVSSKTERAEQPFYVGLVGYITLSTSLSLFIVLLFITRLHAIFSAAALGVSMVLIQSLSSRSMCGGAEIFCNQKMFLWVCYRADFNPNFFISQEVEKEQIDELQEQIKQVESNAQSSATTLAALFEAVKDLQQSVDGLKDRLGHFEQGTGDKPPEEAEQTQLQSQPTRVLQSRKVGL